MNEALNQFVEDNGELLYILTTHILHIITAYSTCHFLPMGWCPDRGSRLKFLIIYSIIFSFIVIAFSSYPMAISGVNIVMALLLIIVITPSFVIFRRKTIKLPRKGDVSLPLLMSHLSKVDLVLSTSTSMIGHDFSVESIRENVEYIFHDLDRSYQVSIPGLVKESQLDSGVNFFTVSIIFMEKEVTISGHTDLVNVMHDIVTKLDLSPVNHKVASLS